MGDPLHPIQSLGAHVLFAHQIFQLILRRKTQWPKVWSEMWRVFSHSILTTSFAGFFVGGIMAILFSEQMTPFGAKAYLGGLVASATFRELGPLLIAFMLSGKVGAYTSAELGLMRVTDQIDALRCLGLNPMREIVLPRFLGIIGASLFLLIWGLVVALIGSFIAASLFADINIYEFYRNIPTILNNYSILSGFIKCMLFSLLLAVICTYQGYFTTGGARGVGLTVVKTAVITMLSLVIADVLSSVLFDWILQMYLEINFISLAGDRLQ